MEYRFFRKEGDTWFFKNPVTGKEMEMTIVQNNDDFNLDVWFGSPADSFTKVVFGDVLGCKTVNDAMRLIDGRESQPDKPLSTIKHFEVESFETVLNLVDPCLCARFGENTKQSTANETPVSEMTECENTMVMMLMSMAKI